MGLSASIWETAVIAHLCVCTDQALKAWSSPDKVWASVLDSSPFRWQLALDSLHIQRQERGNMKGDKSHYRLNPFFIVAMQAAVATA